MGMIAKFRKPETVGQLAKAVELWLNDSIGGVDGVSREYWGGKFEVALNGFAAVIHVEDADPTDGRECVRLDAGQREHLEAWEEAGRPSLEEIQELKGIGRITRVEAAAVRTMRAGEALEQFSFTPEEIARMKRDIFRDILARRVDDQFGESIDPPVSPEDLAADVRGFLLMAYKLEAGGDGPVVDVAIGGRRFVGNFEAVAAPKPKRARKPRPKRSKAKAD